MNLPSAGLREDHQQVYQQHFGLPAGVRGDAVRGDDARLLPLPLKNPARHPC